MKKILALLLALSLTAALCAGCGSTQEETQTTDTTNTTTQEEDVTIRLGGLKGPTSMGMVKLLADNDAGTPTNHYGRLRRRAHPQDASGRAGHSGGAGEPGLRTVQQLRRGRAAAGREHPGGHLPGGKGRSDCHRLGQPEGPDHLRHRQGLHLNYLLEENGLDPATDVTIEWKSEPTEIVAQMAAQDHVIALLPQPFVTVAQSKFEDLAISMDLTEEWDKLDNGSQLITAGLVVRTEFAKEHPQAVADFLEEYNASTAYVNENVAEAAQLVEQYDIVEAAVAEKAIPYCNIVCITGQEMMTSVQGYFQVLFDQNPQSVGGTLPGDDFYYLGQ